MRILIGLAAPASAAAGRYGDIVAVVGDPTQDVSLLARVDTVIKGGAIVKGAK